MVQILILHRLDYLSFRQREPKVLCFFCVRNAKNRAWNGLINRYNPCFALFLLYFELFFPINEGNPSLVLADKRGFFVAGAEGLEVALQPLLRCPKSAGAPVGAADFDRCANPCFLYPPPAASASVARHMVWLFNGKMLPENRLFKPLLRLFNKTKCR